MSVAFLLRVFLLCGRLFFCCALFASRARRPATEQNKNTGAHLVFSCTASSSAQSSRRRPGTAHSPTHASRAVVTPRLPSQKKTSGRVCFLLRGLPEPLSTHTPSKTKMHKRRVFVGQARLPNKNMVRVCVCVCVCLCVFLLRFFCTAQRFWIFFAAPCSPVARAGRPRSKTKTPGRVFFAARPPGTRSLTHAGGAIGTPRPPSKNKNEARLCFLLRGLPEPLTHPHGEQKNKT